MQRYPIAKDLVLVGGGHSHVIVLWMLAMKPVAGLRVTLVSPDVRSAYSGMLPGVVAGHYTADDIHIELGPLCRLAGARLIVARATGIDPVRQTVQLAGRPDIDYDVLSIDVGITPAMSDIEGDTRAIIAVKPINGFLDKFDRFIDRVRSDRIRHVAIVGAGAGGVELCLAVHHRLQLEQRGRQAQVHLVADEKGVLPEFPAAIRDSFSRHIAARNIEIHENFRVAGIEGRSLVSTDDGRLAFDDVFLVTRAAPHGWLA
ncbi:MAG: FAD-dependent oxidoreductase, partial [Pseudomonadales bacterium]|nr:FAD-dependent oxidoreductase [Pseudomonadales bacterium]